MNTHKHNKPLYLLLGLTLGVFAVFLTGCNPNPINTNVEISNPTGTDLGIPDISYHSEKDILFSKTSTDPKTGITDTITFKAVASAPALAQKERELVDALADQAQAEALGNAVKALAGSAATIVSGKAQTNIIQPEQPAIKEAEFSDEDPFEQ